MEISEEVQRGTLSVCCNGSVFTTVTLDGKESDGVYRYNNTICLNNQELAILTKQFILICKLKGIPIIVSENNIL